MNAGLKQLYVHVCEIRTNPCNILYCNNCTSHVCIHCIVFYTVCLSIVYSMCTNTGNPGSHLTDTGSVYITRDGGLTWDQVRPYTVICTYYAYYP